MAREQRKLAAIVAADVVGYSRLMGRDESGTLARLRTSREQLLAPILAQRGGRIVKLTGDGAIIEFASTVEAVSAAVEFQQAVTKYNLDEPSDNALQFRIGLHLGDLIVDSDDLYGDGVNIAARLESEAPAGGIVVSSVARDFIGERVKVRFLDLGELLLKNIERPVRAFRIEWDAADWPAEATSSAYSPLVARSATAALPDRPSIAVLPFTNLSGDPEQEYFADGIAEDMITELSRFRSLFVIARNSSFTYKGRTVDARRAGSELGVRYVFEGSVRRAGPQLRIAVRLVDASSGAQAWSERYDFAAENVFAVQDEVVRKIVAVLPGRLETAELSKVERKTSQSLEAWDFLLRGKYLHHLENPAANREAELCFDESIARDPNFAAAIAWKACTLGQAWNNEWRPRAPDLFSEINRLVRRAYELDENDAECHRIICRISLSQRQFNKSEYHLGRALELTPNDPRLIVQRGINSTYVGEAQAALPWIEQAMRVDPFSAARYETDLARALYAGRRADEAIDVLGRSARSNYSMSLLRAVCHVELGDDRQGLQATTEALSIRPDLTVASVMEGQPWKRVEDSERMENVLSRAGLPR